MTQRCLCTVFRRLESSEACQVLVTEWDFSLAFYINSTTLEEKMRLILVASPIEFALTLSTCPDELQVFSQLNIE
eukprot:g30727.t1